MFNRSTHLKFDNHRINVSCKAILHESWKLLAQIFFADVIKCLEILTLQQIIMEDSKIKFRENQCF